jgi:hypothetical protein
VGSIEAKPGVSGENVHTPNSVTLRKYVEEDRQMKDMRKPKAANKI